MIKVVYTNPYDLKGEVGKINDLFEAGMDELHIRKPGYSKRQMDKFIQQIDFRFWDRLVLHSHFGLVLKYNLKGVHVSANKRRKWKFKWNRFYLKFMKRNVQISTTTSSLEKISRFYTFNKVFLGPLFNSSYESNLLFAFEERPLKKAINKSVTDVIAVGGITPDNVSRIWEFGFDGYALQSTIWKAVDPVLAFHEVNSAEDIGRMAS